MNPFYSNFADSLNTTRFYHPRSAQARATVAVSACLTGQRVRYDGASCYLQAMDWLAANLQLLAICPEVGAGFSVPRPPVQLVIHEQGAPPRALGRDNPKLDVTAPLNQFAQTSAAQLNVASLCGYLWKSRSPSCGLNSTPLFDNTGKQIGRTSGIQANHIQHIMPWLSCCEESDLIDPSTTLAFALRCRLVFDWKYAGNAEFATQHRHYRFLIDRLAGDEQIALEQLMTVNHKADYLTVLQRSCLRLKTEQLLELFMS